MAKETIEKIRQAEKEADDAEKAAREQASQRFPGSRRKRSRKRRLCFLRPGLRLRGKSRGKKGDRGAQPSNAAFCSGRDRTYA